MAIDSHDEALLKRFLVGDVTAEECERIEDGFMVDDEAYDALRALEDEMILDHLRGTLPPGLAGRFARVIAASPVRQQRVEEMRELLAATGATPAPVLTFPRMLRRQVLVLSAAAVLTLAVGVSLLRNSSRTLRPPDNAPGPAEHAPVDMVLELKPVFRGPGDTTNIFTVPTGTDTVTLTFPLALEPQERATFSLGPNGAPPLTLPTTPEIARDGDGRVSVRWTIPATFLPAGDYVLMVTTDAGSGARIRLTRSFTVTM